MTYNQINPPDCLKNHVRYFWTLESSGTDPEPKTFRTIADGCPGLIFQPSEKGTLYQYNKKLPDVFLYGQATKYSEIASSGKFHAVGTYFYPHALQSVFGFRADEWTDTCLDLNLMTEKGGFYLSEQLLNAASGVEQIAILSSYLCSLIEKNNRQADEITPKAVSRIIQSNGNLSLKKLQDSLNLSERSFERKFKQSVGISPKLFSRICRFQASLYQLRNSHYRKLSDIAFENEYADQSHFIRAFKEFAGSSPFQYQRLSNEVVENFAELL